MAYSRKNTICRICGKQTKRGKQQKAIINIGLRGLRMGSVKGKKQNGGGRPSEKSQTKIKGDQIPPKKPSDLGPYASRVWDDAVAALPHILRPLDYAILLLACRAFEVSMTDECPKVRMNASRVFESHARQIGLTPSSRRIVKPVDEIESNETDPFIEFMRKGGLN